jgi:hypothetical protein
MVHCIFHRWLGSHMERRVILAAFGHSIWILSVWTKHIFRVWVAHWFVTMLSRCICHTRLWQSLAYIRRPHQSSWTLLYICMAKCFISVVWLFSLFHASNNDGYWICSLDKTKTKGIKNWRNKHDTHIRKFLSDIDEIEEKLKHPSPRSTPRPFNIEAFNHYLVWYRSNARTQLNPPAFNSEDILLEPNPGFDQMARMQYTKLVREGRRTQLAPVFCFAVSSPLSLHMGITWAKIDQGCCFDSKLSSRNMSSRLGRHSSTLRVNNPTMPLKVLLRYDMDNFIFETFFY